MNLPRSIPEFLAQLRTELQLNPHQSTNRIIAEVEDHLLEARERLRATGLSEEEAEHEAMLDFGAPKRIAKAFRAELARDFWRTLAGVGNMKRTSAIFFHTSIYLTVASTVCFLIGHLGKQRILAEAKVFSIHRAWLEDSAASFQDIWFQIGLGTMVLAIALAAFAWTRWRKQPMMQKEMQ